MLLASYMQIFEKLLVVGSCRKCCAVSGTLQVCWPGFPGLSESTVIVWGLL